MAADSDNTKPRYTGKLLQNTGDKVDFKVYKRRWYVLLLYATVCALQVAFWNAFGPIASSSKVAFGWQNWNLALLICFGPIMFLMTMIPTSWLLKAKGIRYPTLIAIGLMLLGSILRCLPLEKQSYTYTAYFGAMLNGISGPTVLAGSTSLSAAWFPASSRTIATSVCSVALPLGLAISFLVGPALVPGGICLTKTEAVTYNNSKSYDVGNGTSAIANCTLADIRKERSDIMTLFYSETVLVGICFVLALIYFPSYPPTPASISSSLKRQNSLKSDIKKGLSKIHLWLLATIFSLTIAMSNSWLSVVNILWLPLGISQQKTGWIVFSATIGGVLSSLGIAKLASRPLFQKRIKTLIIIINICGAIFCVWAVLMTLGFLPLTDACLFVSVIGSVALLAGAGPLYLEVSCEVAYPLPEAIPTGFLTSFLNIMTLLFMSIFFIPNMTVDWMNWLFGACVLLAIPLCVIFKPGYKRLLVDEESHVI